MSCICVVLMTLCDFFSFFFFFNATAPTEIYTLSLHDALPILRGLTGLMQELVSIATQGG